MRSFIFCTSYINGDQLSHSKDRYDRWIGYYQPLLEQLQAERLFLIDDGGRGYGDINVLSGVLPPTLEGTVQLYRFDENLGRRSITDYPGWWRSFLYAVDIARMYQYDKIIHIESDFFILSERLRTYIRELSSGWTSLYSAHYNFPETGIQVICRDAFDIVTSFKAQHVNADFRTDNFAELILPFTQVNTDFIGDRLGEKPVIDAWLKNSPELLSRLDYIGQI